MKNSLVKVIGIVIKANDNKVMTQTARGILRLKRGQTMLGFISKFLTERGITTYSLHQRAEKAWATSPILFNAELQPNNGSYSITYHFVEFSSTDLGYYAKDLTTAELTRDLKQFKIQIEAHG